MSSYFAQFDKVKGYASRDRAARRGREVVASLPEDWSFRWTIVALPNERFAPLIIINNDIPGGPGPFISYDNVCLIN